MGVLEVKTHLSHLLPALHAVLAGTSWLGSSKALRISLAS